MPQPLPAIRHPAGAVALGKIGLRMGWPVDVRELLFAGTANCQYIECNVNSTRAPSFIATVLEAFFSVRTVVVTACAELSPSAAMKIDTTTIADLAGIFLTAISLQSTDYFRGERA